MTSCTAIRSNYLRQHKPASLAALCILR